MVRVLNYPVRQIVTRTHVNLVDLVTNHPGRARVFESEEQLSRYTRLNKRFFPKENAYAGDLLRYLLRHILNPDPERRGTRRRLR